MEHECSYDGTFGISFSKMGFVILIDESTAGPPAKAGF